MGDALDRLARRLDLVELATRVLVPHFKRLRHGQVEDVDTYTYFRSAGPVARIEQEIGPRKLRPPPVGRGIIAGAFETEQGVREEPYPPNELGPFSSSAARYPRESPVHRLPTETFASLLAERRAVLAELQDLEANAPNPRDGDDFIARRDAYYERKADLQARAEELTIRMQEVRKFEG